MATPEPGFADSAQAARSVTAALPARRPTSPTRAFLGRLLVVHLVGYTIAFASAVAQIPIAIWLRKNELLHVGPTGASIGVVRNAVRGLALSPRDAAQLQIVLGFVLWGSVLVFLLVHVAGLPWAIGAARAARHPELAAGTKKGYRIFGLTCVAIGVMALLVGIAGWVWLSTL